MGKKVEGRRRRWKSSDVCLVLHSSRSNKQEEDRQQQREVSLSLKRSNSVLYSELYPEPFFILFPRTPFMVLGQQLQRCVVASQAPLTRGTGGVVTKTRRQGVAASTTRLFGGTSAGTCTSSLSLNNSRRRRQKEQRQQQR